MKRRPIIGLSITALVLSAILGIASLPDEVLIEKSTVENSEIPLEDIQIVTAKKEAQDPVPKNIAEKTSDKSYAELKALKEEVVQLKKDLNQIKTSTEIPEEASDVPKIEEETVEDESEGEVITVNIRDGVGAKQR